VGTVGRKQTSINEGDITVLNLFVSF